MTEANLLHMDQSADTNAAHWKSEEVAQNWTAKADEREANRAAQWRFKGELLPFGEKPEARPFALWRWRRCEELGVGLHRLRTASIAASPRTVDMPKVVLSSDERVSARSSERGDSGYGPRADDPSLARPGGHSSLRRLVYKIAGEEIRIAACRHHYSK